MKKSLWVEKAAAGGILSVMGLTVGATAGEDVSYHAPPLEVPALEPEQYEAGRGLITLEGPSGLFINPTSATLPENTFTLQYCVFTPNNDGSVIGHGGLAAYGVTDWLEIGATANYISLEGAGDLENAGPFARVRLLKNDGWVPQVSVGAYSRFGDEARESVSAFAAAYVRCPVAENGIVKALGFHAGIRNSWNDLADDLFAGYLGAELQLPYRLYLVGEVQTQDDEEEVPYSFGMQWRLGGINISVAGIQNGNLEDPGFYFGIGTALNF